MITSIQGTLATATPLRAVIEVNGLGYEVHVPVTTAEKLPAPGKPVKLHTHVVYREDAHTLYGFHGEAERDFFRLMIEHVTGVGPKMALTIMSKLSLPMLESAIRAGDIGTLAQCPGIGRKTAERLEPPRTAPRPPSSPAAIPRMPMPWPRSGRWATSRRMPSSRSAAPRLPWVANPRLRP